MSFSRDGSHDCIAQNKRNSQESAVMADWTKFLWRFGVSSLVHRQVDRLKLQRPERRNNERWMWADQLHSGVDANVHFLRVLLALKSTWDLSDLNVHLLKMGLSLPSLVLVFLTTRVTLSAGKTKLACVANKSYNHFAKWWNMFLWFILLSGSNNCVTRSFGHDSVVCECNSTYCDSVGSPSAPPLGQYSSYLSSMAGSRLEPGQGDIQVNSTGAGECLYRDLNGVEGSAALDFSARVFSRPQADGGSLSEVPEDQGIWWSYDRCSGHQHPVPFCWSTGPAAATVLLQWRYTTDTWKHYLQVLNKNTCYATAGQNYLTGTMCLFFIRFSITWNKMQI